MIGIVVMTHGALADGIVNACELFTGPAKQVETLSLKREDNIDDLSTAFEAAVKKVDTGDGVLVFTDLLGGSPCNVASMHLRTSHGFQLLTGVNLPMILEALITREQGMPVEELAQNCRNAGTDGVKLINELLG